MLSLVHTLMSLPLGVYLDNPLIIFLAAATLHFLSDTLPHWNIYPEDTKGYPFVWIALDVVGGVAAAWLLLGGDFLTWPVWAAIAGGNAPDVIHALRDLAPPQRDPARGRWRKRFLGWLEPFFTWHDNIQVETAKPLPGLVWQVALVAGAVVLVWWN